MQDGKGGIVEHERVRPEAAPLHLSPFALHGPSTLVIQTAFLGDVVLTTPLLAALAQRHGPVDVVTTPAAAPLLETHPAVATLIRYDKRGADRGWSGFRRLAARLRERRYTRVYLPHQSWRSAALALAAGIRQRTGFADSAAAITYTTLVPRARTGHEAERLLALAGARDQTVPAVSLGLTPDDHAVADEWLRQRALNFGFVALAPGSIWGTKRWPWYAELAAMLDGPVVVVGSKEDDSLAQAVAAAAPGRTHSAAGALSLRASAALIQRAAVLVTNDSAPLHFATAVGTPVVALFGPTTPRFGFGPRGPRDRVLELEGLDCRPCSAHGPQICPLGHHHCMQKLSVETVQAAVLAILGLEERGAIRPGR
jgi:lipopolysaccharide heptosyltransferase II